MGPTGRPTQGATTGSATASMPCTTHSRPPPMTAPPMPQNARKYYKFHEQSGHTTTECRELKKAHHELADKVQIDLFLKRGPRMIRLPVHFGDKTKSKSLEVDVLVVDVPTTYNVILWLPTLHKKRKERARGHTSGSPPSSRSSSSEAPALASKGLVASSPASSPSAEGGITPPPQGHGPHRRPADARPRSEALLVALLLSLGHISPGLHQHLLQPTQQPMLLSFAGIQISPQPFAMPLVPRNEPLQSSAFRRRPHPLGEDLGHGYLFISYLRGIRNPMSH
ncbi:hypothetical protein Cgig2_016919 [Carnegiea gigantea]|uniref:Uncharacterized protein n=1 Tax=Carnegiea gigantea TaxID=171969 RepID=A0A9Q1GT56_9CARY|nr:hypothetical protein Cgig2_016919 [Carnegiea gigantea]